MQFCAWLGRREGKTYRLPTEAEWEYACRGGTASAYQTGNDPVELVHAGNVADASFSTQYSLVSGSPIAANDGHVCTATVGQFRPNAFGLYDLHGNVWEWCSDWSGTYPDSTVSDPQGPPQGTDRIFRGGSWLSDIPYNRSAYRSAREPTYRNSGLGFRVVRVADP